MRTLVDGHVLADADTLAQALRTAVDHATRRGRIIVDVTVDGRTVPDEVLTAPPDRSTGREMRATTADVRTLLAEAFAEAADMLVELIPKQDEVGRLLQAGEIEQARERLGELFTSWDRAHSALTQGRDLLGLDRHAAEIDAHASSLVRSLHDVRTGLQGGDWCAVADTVRYALSPEAQRWGTFLRRLSADVRASAPAQGAP